MGINTNDHYSNLTCFSAGDFRWSLVFHYQTEVPQRTDRGQQPGLAGWWYLSGDKRDFSGAGSETRRWQLAGHHYEQCGPRNDNCNGWLACLHRIRRKRV